MHNRHYRRIFKHNKLREELDIQFVPMFSYYLLRRDIVKEPQGPLKNQEIQDS